MLSILCLTKKPGAGAGVGMEPESEPMPEPSKTKYPPTARVSFTLCGSRCRIYPKSTQLYLPNNSSLLLTDDWCLRFR